MKRLFSAVLTAFFLFVPPARAQTDGFGIYPLDETVRRRITGVSFPSGADARIAYGDLRLIRVRHYGFDGEIENGELICAADAAPKILAVFRELFENKYEIEKIKLIDDYGANDEKSMTDNNTSCFNYRLIAGSKKLSNHSFGRAVDLNPLYNPYVKIKADRVVVSPTAGKPYADRTRSFARKIDADDLAVKVFKKHGFVWGGDWKSVKDYQHFELPEK